MKIFNEAEITLEGLIEATRSEPAIITRDGTPVMVALPVGDREREAWNERLVTLVKDWMERSRQGSNPASIQSQERSPDIDPGMVEVSMALAGVALAIAAFLPGIAGMAALLRIFVAVLSGGVAFFSSYSALWLLACYCLGVGLKESGLFGFREVRKLLISTYKVGPYWFMALGLLFLLALSVFVVALAVGG